MSNQLNQDPMTMSPEDLLYEVMDEMNKSQLEELKKDIEDEIELRKYKEKRVRQIKLEIGKETDKILAQAKLRIGKSKHLPDQISEDEDEVIEVKPKRKSRK